MDMDAVFSQAMELSKLVASKMAELAVQYGPDLIEAALLVVRIHSANQLAVSLFLLFLAILAFLNARRWYGKWYALPATHKVYSYILECHQGLISFVSAVIGLVLSISAICVNDNALLNLWHYIGIIEPKLWIAHEILIKIIK